MSSRKIFVTPFKTGTTSTGKALETLGYKVLFHSPNIFSKVEYNLIFLLNDVIKHYQRFMDIPPETKNDVRKLLHDLLWDKMSEYDCASDFPMGHEGIHPFIKKIIFPEAKFIFLERDRDSWVNSVKHHETITQTPSSHIKLFWEHANLASSFTWNNYLSWRQTYLDLQNVFPDDVLFMDIKQGWVPLLKFLNLSNTNLPGFPWENKKA